MKRNEMKRKKAVLSDNEKACVYGIGQILRGLSLSPLNMDPFFLERDFEKRFIFIFDKCKMVIIIRYYFLFFFFEISRIIIYNKV